MRTNEVKNCTLRKKVFCTGPEEGKMKISTSPTNQPRKDSFHLYFLSPHLSQFHRTRDQRYAPVYFGGEIFYRNSGFTALLNTNLFVLKNSTWLRSNSIEYVSASAILSLFCCTDCLSFCLIVCLFFLPYYVPRDLTLYPVGQPQSNAWLSPSACRMSPWRHPEFVRFCLPHPCQSVSICWFRVILTRYNIIAFVKSRTTQSTPYSITISKSIYLVWE